MSIERTRSTLNVAVSLFGDNRDNLSGRPKPVYFRHVSSREKIPPNVDEDILEKFSTIAMERKLIVSTRPYWQPNTVYNPWEILMATVQFFDEHNEPLPLSVLPPKKDLYTFKKWVLESPKPLSVSDQFQQLLDITGNNVIGAGNLGFIATRLLSRGRDLRAYPESVTVNDILKFNSKITQFEVYGNSKIDGPGDTYYFWTHFFAGCTYKAINSTQSKLLNHFYAFGTPIMTTIRKTIGHPTLTPHHEASLIGRNVAFAVMDLAVL